MAHLSLDTSYKSTHVVLATRETCVSMYLDTYGVVELIRQLKEALEEMANA